MSKTRRCFFNIFIHQSLRFPSLPVLRTALYSQLLSGRHSTSGAKILSALPPPGLLFHRSSRAGPCRLRSSTYRPHLWIEYFTFVLLMLYIVRLVSHTEEIHS